MTKLAPGKTAEHAEYMYIHIYFSHSDINDAIVIKSPQDHIVLHVMLLDAFRLSKQTSLLTEHLFAKSPLMVM